MIYKMLGIEKLNTIASHLCSQKRFNRALKSIFRKYNPKFEMQRDQYISGVVWAYHNTHHSCTGEKNHHLVLVLIVILQWKQPSYTR